MRWHQPLPLSAYQRLAADPCKQVRDALLVARRVPREVLVMLTHDQDPGIAKAASARLQPPQPEPLTGQEAEARACDDSEWTRAEVAAHPGLPASLVTALATDLSPHVRLAVSMRSELSEAQRGSIDYHVAPEDRLRPVSWAADTDDRQTLRCCVHSTHLGLRRSVAYNPNLTPDLISVLAGDSDFAVRLLLCENHAGVPGALVLRTYLEARVITRSDLLHHPAFPRTDLARLADSANWEARKLVSLDPGAPADLIERLSHDQHPAVRVWTASDPRLSRDRLVELFHDPQTTGAAAANPHLPPELMEPILTDASGLSGPPEDAAIILGVRSSPSFVALTDT